MTGRERFLRALNKEKPDRLPAQVHGWMDYYRNTYLKGMDQFEAYAHFGADWSIYAGPRLTYADRDLANWQRTAHDVRTEPDGTRVWRDTITTPEGVLSESFGANAFTTWNTEHIVKSEAEFELWRKYAPVPAEVDWAPVREILKRVGDRGIVRGGLIAFGQYSPWQSFCTLYGTEQAIMACFDKPDWVHHALRSILDKVMRIEIGGRIPADLVETGGGAGSSTVISPDLFREFCLPYDRKFHDLLHSLGTKVVYHLCGGLMPMLDLVAENGADGLETMTPPAMGGDCDLAEAYRRVAGKLFLIGGFDQNAGFEKGNPPAVRKMVKDLHAACPNGGYIVSPSDHFFFGQPENIRAFFDAAKACTYQA
ncbi:MAG: uroporphyrinogen decarboxylase family protein [Kiritimatiellae bacterium]|nr:uroporphyrinogen decarboxylase family protein [Kiritimatiellia bacterium]